MKRQPPTMRLQRIGAISWSKLFHNWENGEAKQIGWIRHYRDRGFSSWREWRTTAYQGLRPQKRKWTLYKVERPEQVVPAWFIGPFRGWRIHYHGRAVTFRTLARRPAIQRNVKIKSIERNFPKSTQLIGVIWRNRIVVIEGTHRACAVALAAQQQKNIKTSLTIALTPLSGTMPSLSSGYKNQQPKKKQ